MERPQFDLEKLAAFCREHRIRKLSLFGSVLHGTNGPHSDLDLLVEFEPDVRIGLFGFAGVEIELSEVLDAKVDLRTAEDLSHFFRQQVVDEAEALYVAA
jgi:uncharacterized protein